MWSLLLAAGVNGYGGDLAGGGRIPAVGSVLRGGGVPASIGRREEAAGVRRGLAELVVVASCSSGAPRRRIGWKTGGADRSLAAAAQWSSRAGFRVRELESGGGVFIGPCG